MGSGGNTDERVPVEVLAAVIGAGQHYSAVGDMDQEVAACIVEELRRPSIIRIASRQ